ncbi:hypothetical protein KTO58_18920 [Chitinophaga pendula]|uniref:hypothetical protein n=1 Tax=Chitinophaga TaxID=79328 RepID=UPI000BAEC5AE|nr:MULTISPECIES: hypothetical protein [Chitinophaga]ASZ11254.1 hypothetical protein CK934_09890 [Chitinophaga sp. MD30]UCJ05747.1 hypothetical protein KTO58_18920 [Chitinophaga pendula]
MDIVANHILDKFLYLLKTTESNYLLLKLLKNDDLLTTDFEERYILNAIDKQFKDIEIAELSSENIIIYLDAIDNLTYRIEMKKKEKTWKIKSFLFQCQGCFGEDPSRGVCDGSGWGVQ